jgi:outer membrane protein assembly factor BamE
MKPVLPPAVLCRPLWGVVLAATLAGCSTVEKVATSVSTLGGRITPYKIDVLQGNVVTKEQAEMLKPGMPREDVRNLLGTPLLASVFHAQRWDYVFTFRRQGAEPQQRKLSVFFDGDRLQRFVADELPSEADFVAALDVRRKSDKVPALEATEAQLKAFDEKNVRPAQAASPGNPAPVATPASNYPPLESR